MAEVMYKIIQAKDFVKAKPTGEIDLEQSKRILGDLADIAAMPEAFDILMDIREAFGNLDQSDVWELVEELGRHRKAFKNKIAVLARDDAQFSKAVFAEMCAHMSVHDYKLSAFTEYERAIEWLLAGDGLDGLWK
jgi:hypothetical protein